MLWTVGQSDKKKDWLIVYNKPIEWPLQRLKVADLNHDKGETNLKLISVGRKIYSRESIKELKRIEVKCIRILWSSPPVTDQISRYLWVNCVHLLKRKKCLPDCLMRPSSSWDLFILIEFKQIIHLWKLLGFVDVIDTNCYIPISLLKFV